MAIPNNSMEAVPCMLSAAETKHVSFFLYNLVSTPGGFLCYIQEKRMVRPLAAGIISGTLPGVLFVRLMLDYFKAVGIRVNAKEVTGEASRQNAKAELSGLNTEYDVPFEPTLIANIENYVPTFHTVNFMYSYQSPYWPDQWFFRSK
jgi:hypothetical protein